MSHHAQQEFITPNVGTILVFALVGVVPAALPRRPPLAARVSGRLVPGRRWRG